MYEWPHIPMISPLEDKGCPYNFPGVSDQLPRDVISAGHASMEAALDASTMATFFPRDQWPLCHHEVIPYACSQVPPTQNPITQDLQDDWITYFTQEAAREADNAFGAHFGSPYDTGIFVRGFPPYKPRRRYVNDWIRGFPLDDDDDDDGWSTPSCFQDLEQDEEIFAIPVTNAHDEYNEEEADEEEVYGEEAPDECTYEEGAYDDDDDDEEEEEEQNEEAGDEGDDIAEEIDAHDGIATEAQTTRWDACPWCTEDDFVDDMIQCDRRTCRQWFHYYCVGVSTESIEGEQEKHRN